VLRRFWVELLTGGIAIVVVLVSSISPIAVRYKVCAHTEVASVRPFTGRGSLWYVSDAAIQTSEASSTTPSACQGMESFSGGIRFDRGARLTIERRGRGPLYLSASAQGAGAVAWLYDEADEPCMRVNGWIDVTLDDLEERDRRGNTVVLPIDGHLDVGEETRNPTSADAPILWSGTVQITSRTLSGSSYFEANRVELAVGEQFLVDAPASGLGIVTPKREGGLLAVAYSAGEKGYVKSYGTQGPPIEVSLWARLKNDGLLRILWGAVAFVVGGVFATRKAWRASGKAGVVLVISITGFSPVPCAASPVCGTIPGNVLVAADGQMGRGLAVWSKGRCYVATALHVVDDADLIEVVGSHATRSPALRVLRFDQEDVHEDVALLRVAENHHEICGSAHWPEPFSIVDFATANPNGHIEYLSEDGGANVLPIRLKRPPIGPHFLIEAVGSEAVRSTLSGSRVVLGGRTVGMILTALTDQNAAKAIAYDRLAALLAEPLASQERPLSTAEQQASRESLNSLRLTWTTPPLQDQDSSEFRSAEKRAEDFLGASEEHLQAVEGEYLEDTVSAIRSHFVLVPILNAVAKGTWSQEPVVAVLELDASGSAVLPFGELDPPREHEGEIDYEWEEENPRKEAAGIAFAESLERWIRMDLPRRRSRFGNSYPQPRATRDSASITWDLDPQTLAQAVDSAGGSTRLSANFPRTIRLLILTSIEALPFSSDNFTSLAVTRFWHDLQSSAVDRFGRSLLTLTPNGKAIWRAAYCMRPVAMKRIADDSREFRQNYGELAIWEGVRVDAADKTGGVVSVVRAAVEEDNQTLEEWGVENSECRVEIIHDPTHHGVAVRAKELLARLGFDATWWRLDNVQDLYDVLAPDDSDGANEWAEQLLGARYLVIFDRKSDRRKALEIAAILERTLELGEFRVIPDVQQETTDGDGIATQTPPNSLTVVLSSPLRAWDG